MAILRVLAGQHLPCGCLVGIYERYDGTIVGVLDARSDVCAEARHSPGSVVPVRYPASPEPFRTAAAATTPLSPTSPTRFGKT